MFNISLVGSLAMVLVVAAVVAKIAGGPAKSLDAADTPRKPSHDTPSQAGASVVPAGSQVPPPPTTGGSKTLNTGAATKPVVVQLRDLLNNDSGDPLKAASVLARLEKLDAQATTSEERYLAAVARSNALAAKGTKRADTLAACAVLRKIPPQVVGDHKSSVDERINITLACP